MGTTGFYYPLHLYGGGFDSKNEEMNRCNSMQAFQPSDSWHCVQALLGFDLVRKAPCFGCNQALLVPLPMPFVWLMPAYPMRLLVAERWE